MKKLYTICFILCFCTNIFAQHNFSVNFSNGAANKPIYYRVTSVDAATVAVTFRGDLPTSYREYTDSIIVPAVVTAPATVTPPAITGVIYHVTSVDAYAFYDNIALTKVTLPNSVTMIDTLAFGNCTVFKKCIMPQDINFIAPRAFERCTSLPEITLPTNITKISKETFRDCHSLTSINIPNMVNTIGEKAFFNCKSLESVNISSSVNKIGLFAFLGCSSLNSFNVDPDNPILMSEDGILYSYMQDTLMLYPAKKTGTEFTIPDIVKNVGDYSFSYNLYLKKINLNNFVEKIGTAAFYNSTGLSVVNISDNVSYIGEGAFYNCRNLDTIKITATTPPDYEEFTFYNVPNEVIIAVECDFVEDYKNSQWGEYFNNITDYDCAPIETSISDVEYNQEVIIYPNPVKNVLYIDIPFFEYLKNVEIVDITGKKILIPHSSLLDTHYLILDTNSLPQGIYLVKIYTDKDVITKKIIKN